MLSRVARSSPVLALLLVSACVSVPSSEQFRATRAVFPEESSGRPVADGRAGFRQSFCSILQRDGLAASGDPQCESSLWKLSDEPSPGGSPDRSATPDGELRWFVVSGALGDCFGPDGQPFASGIAHLRERGERIELITVSGRSGAEHNARQIAEALWSAGIQPGDRVAFVGYSKGTIDILQFLVDCPELASEVVAVVGLSSPVAGSPLAGKAEWAYRHLLASSFSKRCAPGDAEVVTSLVPQTRRQWLADHPLPESVKFYSLGAFTTTEHLARGLRPAWKLLAAADPRNDGQVLIGDAIIPGSTLLGYANADHWGLALTIENVLPYIAGRRSPHQFPKDQLLEAIVLYVSESLPGD